MGIRMDVSESRTGHSLENQLKEQRDLIEIGRAANSTLNLNELFERVTETLRPYIDFDRLAVSLFQPNGELTRGYVTGTGAENIDAGSHVIPSLEPMERATDGSLKISESSEHIHAGGTMDQLGLKSWAEAKINGPQGHIGFLSIRSTRPNAYTEDDVERLRKAAELIAPAITNATLFAQTSAEQKLHEAQAEIGRIIASTLDIAEVYPQVTDIIANVIPFDRFSVISVDVKTGINQINYVSGIEMDGQQPGATTAVPKSALSFILEHRLPIVVDQTIVDRFPILQAYVDLGASHGLHSWFIAPLIWKGTIIGQLAFRSKDQNAYTETHISHAALIASQLAGAVANSMSYQDERRKAEIETALSKVAISVSQDLDLHRIYETLATELNNLIPYDRLAVVHYDHDTRKVTLDFQRGLSIPNEQPGSDVSDPANPENWQDLIRAGGDNHTTERADQLRNLGLNSWIQAPIGTLPGKPDGFLSLRSKNVDQYNDDDLALLKQFCERVTPALQNARRFEQAQELIAQTQRADYLDEQNIELQRQADARTEFLSSVSHELRTPLTAVSAFADILARNSQENLNNRQLDQIEIIRRSSDSLRSLIDDLLDEAKAIDGKLELTPEPFSVEETLTEFIDSAKIIVANKNQEIAVIDECDECWINADKKRIIQILNNLISNANKYSEPNTKITFAVKKNQGKLHIDVTDQGIGISPNDIDNIFTPFFRSPNSEVRTETGTGLGLAIVKSIIELHGGAIEAKSKLGAGTTFSLWLPGIIEKQNTPQP